MMLGTISNYKRADFLWMILGPVFCIFVLAWSSPIFAQSLAGSYVLAGDSDGTGPKKKAVITLTFQGRNEGTLTAKATQPGETLNDTGTYVIAGTSITMRFKELEWRVENQPFTFDGCTLVLPFKALSGSPGPGSSTWVKKDAACNKQRTATLQQAQTSSQQNTAPKSESAQPASKNTDTSHPSMQSPISSEKESCVQCKYIPCIKSIIKQKEAIVVALKAIAAQRKWGSLDKPGDDFFDLNTLDSPEKRQQVKKDQEEDREAMWNQVYQQLNPALAKELKENCKMRGAGELAMKTDPMTCEIDKKSIETVKEAMPCKDLFEISYIHETYHRTKCLERVDKKLITVFTPRGEAKEEVEAYTQSIALLRELLKKVEPKCPWLCRCNQQRYESAAACTQNCPHTHLSVCHAPTCLELDPKTQEWIPGKGRAF